MATTTKRKALNGDSRNNSSAIPSSAQNGHASSGDEKINHKSLIMWALQLAPAFIDQQVALAMVFGGCCANAWSYEQLLRTSPGIGSALTFFQMLFIAVHSLPSFLTFQGGSWFPRLKPRQVPLSRWLTQVLLVVTSSLLNNWAHFYNVPLTIIIVFRSAGLGISMLFGFVFLKKRYALSQILCVAVVSAGAILATVSRPSASEAATTLKSKDDAKKYIIGVSMMVVSSVATGFLGLLQELTYQNHGPCWKEGVFYTHFLSLPIFVFLFNDIKLGIYRLSSTNTGAPSAIPFIILLCNIITQLICVSGVNKLNTQMSSVSTNLVLTTRKALSLCFSVWWFGNGWNAQFGLGAAMVFLGSISFSMVGQKHKFKTS
ncbi:hypothetical protein AX14_005456 [Amanita brunnescens Koide BX004]|nr:hypothetical protein AX14_005456 [Amanita brunnescens Koide BX004]